MAVRRSNFLGSQRRDGFSEQQRRSFIRDRAGWSGRRPPTSTWPFVYWPGSRKNRTARATSSGRPNREIAPLEMWRSYLPERTLDSAMPATVAPGATTLTETLAPLLRQNLRRVHQRRLGRRVIYARRKRRDRLHRREQHDVSSLTPLYPSARRAASRATLDPRNWTRRKPPSFRGSKLRARREPDRREKWRRRLKACRSFARRQAYASITWRLGDISGDQVDRGPELLAIAARKASARSRFQR